MHLTLTTQPVSYRYLGLVSLSLVSVLTGCRTSSISTTTAPSPAPNHSVVLKPASPEEAPAIIREIPEQPVFLQLLNTSDEVVAREGIGLRRGEKLRTQGTALVQIEFKNGPMLRLSKDAILTLKPDSSLHLARGEMLLWAESGRSTPVKLILPGAIVQTKNATLSVTIPSDPKENMELLAWEGTATVQLHDQSEQVELKTGDITNLKQGTSVSRLVRASVRSLSELEWLDRRFQSPLFDAFENPLPTLAQLDKAAPSKAKLGLTASIPRPVKLATKTQNPEPHHPVPRPSFPVTPSPAPMASPQVVSQTSTSFQASRPIRSATPKAPVTTNPVRYQASNNLAQAPETQPSPDRGRFAEFNPYFSDSKRKPSPEQMDSFCERFPFNSLCVKRN